MMVMMVVMPMAAIRGATHLGQSLGQGVIGTIKSSHRLFDQGGNFFKTFLTSSSSPLNKFRLMAVIVLNPMGQ